VTLIRGLLGIIVGPWDLKRKDKVRGVEIAFQLAWSAANNNHVEVQRARKGGVAPLRRAIF